MRRKHRLLPIFVILAAFTLSSCSLLDIINGGLNPISGEVSPNRISLNTTRQTISVGEQYQLEATISPDNATNKKVNWESLNTSVARVDNNGLVTGLREGSAIISVTSEAISSLGASCIITVSGSSSVIYPTSITLNSTAKTLDVNDTFTLVPTVLPSNATDKSVLFTSDNNLVASVNSSGVVTAHSEGSATITVESNAKSSVYENCIITVRDSGTGDKDEWTIMIYMCGADLESYYADYYDEGLASMDITEILSVSGQPSDVNIIIETGGASKWGSKYGISSSKLERWHVTNKKLVKDTSLTYKSMGLQSTFENFLTWGLTSYPAQKTGVILWNHGGAMDGVCFDEKKDDDSLLNSEVSAALENVFEAQGIEKLEWIGYDACLMQIQDIAEFNSHYFNYMVGAQESEAGEGWDYDTWVDDLYAKKSTTTILQAIVDGFIADNGGTSSSSNDQTLSYLNLAYMPSYLEAFEDFAYSLSRTSGYSKSSFRNMMKNNVKYYAKMTLSSSEYNEYVNDYGYPESWFEQSGKNYILLGYMLYGSFDVVDMLNKVKTNYSSLSSDVDDLLYILDNLIAYESKGAGAGNSNGLCVICSMGDDSSVPYSYTSSETNFSTWRGLFL